jgi:predicted nucleic acid-binding protein
LTVYVDSSVLVRIIARQPNPLAGLESLGDAIASTLIEVEVPRAIDALQRAGGLPEEAAAVALANGRAALRGFDLIEIDAPVRWRAGGPLGSPLRSLDAIHLASALRWRDENPDEQLTFATHDERLARAAQMHGFTVIGWP